MSNPVTLASHVIEQQKAHPTASGEFSWLFCGITLATKIIASHVRRAGLVDILGSTGTSNIHDEEVQKLDMIANETIRRCLGYRGNVGIVASEEDDKPIVIEEGRKGKYIVLFDPLDGSSNIDVHMPTGTIFSILKRTNSDDLESQVLQPGRKQLAAGYVLYGSSTVMAYTTGNGVHMFTLDPQIGAFVLTHEDVLIPAESKMYSINEGYYDRFPSGYRKYLQRIKKDGYRQRFVGTLVADFHRMLLKGGVFLYPQMDGYPDGKLRLMYEANPMAFLAEQAGGDASDGEGAILEKRPAALHQRTPLVVGSIYEVGQVMDCLRESAEENTKDIDMTVFDSFQDKENV